MRLEGIFIVSVCYLTGGFKKMYPYIQNLSNGVI